MRVRRWAGAILCVGLASGLALGFEAAEKRIAGWGHVHDPDDDCKVVGDEGKLTIEVPGTAHDLSAELDRMNAPRVLRPIRGDFLAQVKVGGGFEPSASSVIEGRLAFHGGGLLLWKDKANYIRAERAAINQGDALRNYLNFELRKDGQMDVSRYEIELPAQAVWVRLERRGERIIGSVSLDGLDWKAYEPIRVDWPKGLDIGVAACNSSDRGNKIVFEEYDLYREVRSTEKDEPRDDR